MWKSLLTGIANLKIRIQWDELNRKYLETVAE